MCSIFAEFDHAIDEEGDGRKATIMVHFHYLIWFGINLVTIAYDYINIAHPRSAHMFLISGVGLFYTGVLLHTIFNKKIHRLDRVTSVSIVITIIAGEIIGFIFIDSIPISTSVLLITGIIADAIFTRFNFARRI